MQISWGAGLVFVPPQMSFGCAAGRRRVHARCSRPYRQAPLLKRVLAQHSGNAQNAAVPSQASADAFIALLHALRSPFSFSGSVSRSGFSKRCRRKAPDVLRAAWVILGIRHVSTIWRRWLRLLRRCTFQAQALLRSVQLNCRSCGLLW